MIPKEEMPKPVADAVSGMFKADKINKVYRNELEYYQFNETTPAGEPVVVRMRTNGDVVKVISPSAQEEEATLASEKQGPEGKEKAKAKKPAK
jgi:hypothetical protein